MNARHRFARTLLRRSCACVLFGAGAVACLATGRGGGEMESRFATVHNALTAIGMSEVGALHQTHLGDGEERKIDLELPIGCTTIVAVGAASIGDLDASLVDVAGTRIARGMAHTSEATIRACNDSAGTYALKLKAAHGTGSVLVSTWSGGAPADPAVARGGELGRALGTCEAPLPLSAGEFAGSTVHAEHQNDGKCQSTPGPELVYKLELRTREKVLIAVATAADFDSVIYLRKGDCADKEAEVACNDDAPPSGADKDDKDTRHSRLEEVLDAGTYYLFVDGYNAAKGSFKMHVEQSDVPPLAELCNKAQALADGTPTSGAAEGTFDNVGATCGEGAHGPDSIYTLDVTRRSRVRAVMHADDFPPVVHLRGRCDDATTGIGCSEAASVDHEATFLDVLDPGTYTVFADSSQHDATGKFTILAETAPELGSGVQGDRCRDAIPLTKSESSVSGDTFAAKDDVAGWCGGTGAADMVYRLDVPARTRLTAHLGREEGSHVLVLLHSCDVPKAEIDCGQTLDRVLLPGTYFIAVDGASPASFGKFTLEWSTHDTQAQDVACRAPKQLRPGETVTATTLGGVDKFSPSCASGDAGAGAADQVYKIVLPARGRAHLRLHTGGWGAVLAVRRACVEGEHAAVAAREVECHAEDGPEIDFDSVLDAGTYFVVIDGKEMPNAGSYTLEYNPPH